MATPKRKKKQEKKSESTSKSAPAKAASERAVPEMKAHPDAKLTKTQMKKLYARLLEERDTILGRSRKHVGQATADAAPLPEEIDVAQRATDQEYALRLADKERKLLDQIQIAIEKMESGEYGICEGTEEPIGFRRLEIRPWARYSVEYKERLDRMQR